MLPLCGGGGACTGGIDTATLVEDLFTPGPDPSKTALGLKFLSMEAKQCCGGVCVRCAWEGADWTGT